MQGRLFDTCKCLHPNKRLHSTITTISSIELRNEVFISFFFAIFAEKNEKMKKTISYAALTGIFMALAVSLASCEGRKADNMEPTGETVHVVIPVADVAEDSAIAN